ncbi:MAG: hypothetical protein IJU28_01960 [Clostridia bacterium]|nr:hypothetical protein [Clostridia bacterium]
MENAEKPLLHISGTLSVEDTVKVWRFRGIQHFWKYALIYLLLCALVFFGTSLYYWYSDLRDGYITVGEWLDYAIRGVFDGSIADFVIIGFLIIYALYLIVIRPTQVGKRIRELNPGGTPLTYDFYEDRIVFSTMSKSVAETYQIEYAKVQRKIKEDKYSFRLSTGQKNRIGLSKIIMTAEEIESVRKLLKERCPQRKAK